MEKKIPFSFNHSSPCFHFHWTNFSINKKFQILSISQPQNLESFNLKLLVIDKSLVTMLIDVVQTPNYSDLTINIKYGQSKYFLYQTPYHPKIEKNNPKFLHI